MSEDRATRLKRLHMRSMRRGIKEMDLILSRFWAQEGAGLSDDEIKRFDFEITDPRFDDRPIGQLIIAAKCQVRRYQACLHRIKLQPNAIHLC